MNIHDSLKKMVDLDASDLFYHVGVSPRYKIDGKVLSLDNNILNMQDLTQAVEDITPARHKDTLKNKYNVDFIVYSSEMDRRFRINMFIQRGTPSIVIRHVKTATQTFEELNLPGEVLKKLSMEMRGLVILTGTMGSGKSTTIASMIEHINNNTKKHILTVEDPIEYAFKDKECLINQREIGTDVPSYSEALRSFTLQSPDVLFISNIRDYETMRAAMTAAETGVLVLSTLHTVNAAQSVERIINFFPPHQHQEIRNELSSLLKGVIALRLVPLKGGKGRIPAYEVMLLTSTIGRLIREGKVREIPQFIEEGGVFGMQSFMQTLVKLVREEKVSQEDAEKFADNKEEFVLTLKGIRKDKL